MKIKRRTLRLIIRRVLQFAIISFLVALFYGYFYTPYFTITTYIISGVDDESKQSINEKLHALDTQKAYKIFPRDKIFTYSNSAITDTVLEIVPETKAITMRPVGLHTVKIDITLLRPLFRVSNSQALTEDGIIFSTKYKLDTYPLLTVASSSTRTIKEHGITFTQLLLPDTEVTTPFFTNLNAMSSKISSIIFPVASIVVEPTGDISCYNEAMTSKVIFLKETDFKKVWSTLVSAIDTDPLKSKLAKNREGLEYLDVRYGNKVFYRFNDMTFQNGTVNGILGNHATTTQEVPATSTSAQ